MNARELIYPNSSYFVSLDISDEQAVCMAEFAKRHGCRTYRCRTVDDLFRAVDVMSRCLGVFVFAKGLEAAQVAGVTDKLNQGKTANIVIGVGEPDVAGVLDRFLAALIPPQLDKLALFCAGHAFPTFFEGLSAWRSEASDRGSFDRQVIHSTVAGDVMGFCNLKINLKNAAAAYGDRDESRIMGDALEATNQFLGLVTQNLAQVNLTPKIGLPTVFDLKRVPEVRTLVYFPSVRVLDDKGIFALSLGYSHLEGAPLFDLTGIEPSAGSDEIEML